MILYARRHADDDGFGVAADVDPIHLALPRPGRRFRIRREGKAALWAEEFCYFREKGEAVALGLYQSSERGKALFALDVARNQLDAVVAKGMRFDDARSIKRDGRVHRDRTRMKEIERPNVERSSGEVHARRCFGLNDHVCPLGRFCGVSCRASLTEELSTLKR